MYPLHAMENVLRVLILHRIIFKRFYGILPQRNRDYFVLSYLLCIPVPRHQVGLDFSHFRLSRQRRERRSGSSSIWPRRKTRREKRGRNCIEEGFRPNAWNKMHLLMLAKIVFHHFHATKYLYNHDTLKSTVFLFLHDFPSIDPPLVRPYTEQYRNNNLINIL